MCHFYQNRPSLIGEITKKRFGPFFLDTVIIYETILHYIKVGLLMRPEHNETKANTETKECKTKTETETKKLL